MFDYKTPIFNDLISTNNWAFNGSMQHKRLVKLNQHFFDFFCVFFLTLYSLCKSNKYIQARYTIFIMTYVFVQYVDKSSKKELMILICLINFISQNKIHFSKKYTYKKGYRCNVSHTDNILPKTSMSDISIFLTKSYQKV